MLNETLREQNIDRLFLFRFVIADIYRQLKENQCQSPVRVYRVQVISNDELDILRRSSVGGLISNNSYFSTTIDRHRVFFVVDADPSIVTSKPFAHISAFSEFSNENEILFMAGCVFRLVDIHLENNDNKFG